VEKRTDTFVSFPHYHRTIRVDNYRFSLVADNNIQTIYLVHSSLSLSITDIFSFIVNIIMLHNVIIIIIEIIYRCTTNLEHEM
jgi:hypothetical protein